MVLNVSVPKLKYPKNHPNRAVFWIYIRCVRISVEIESTM